MQNACISALKVPRIENGFWLTMNGEAVNSIFSKKTKRNYKINYFYFLE